MTIPLFVLISLGCEIYWKNVLMSSDGALHWANLKGIQPAIIYSKLTIETLEQGVKYVQS